MFCTWLYLRGGNKAGEQMSKIKKHANVHGKGGGAGKVTHTTHQKKPARLRKIITVSPDAGAWIVDNPLYLTLYTGATLALMYIIKILIQ